MPAGPSSILHVQSGWSTACTCMSSHSLNNIIVTVYKCLSLTYIKQYTSNAESEKGKGTNTRKQKSQSSSFTHGLAFYAFAFTKHTECVHNALYRVFLL
jgi:hypothetical protein